MLLSKYGAAVFGFVEIARKSGSDEYAKSEAVEIKQWKLFIIAVRFIR